MSTATNSLPITDTQTPADAASLAEVVRQASQSETPIYPLGGETSLQYGLPTTREGLGLSTSGLQRIVDYPARDMTVTVEAGVTMERLAHALAAEGQHLPIDVPDPERATIGGVIATGWNGPRRYGQGVIRDYVIGVSAVDGRGAPFHGGGRVVKNVAGYDFCKLLTGSLGTLAVITQVTLKVKPLPERSVLAVCTPRDLAHAEQLLAALVHSQTTPSAIELLSGAAWSDATSLPDGDWRLVVGLEGSAAEVDWMIEQLASEWREQDVDREQIIDGEAARDLWRRLAQFPADEAALVLKAAVPPSQTTRMIAAAREVDSSCSIQAHAGNGIVFIRFEEFPKGGLSRALIGNLQPVAAKTGGSLIIVSNSTGAEMTHQSVWGVAGGSLEVMNAVKRQFDPKNILNPGRFVYV